MALKAQRIVDQIKALKLELRQHQDRCCPKKVKKTARSNTGNYDPSADSYWYDCECPTCLRMWVEPQ